MLSERALHLVADDVRRLAGFLDIHTKLDKIQEKLQTILILRVTALDREGKIRFAVF